MDKWEPVNIIYLYIYKVFERFFDKGASKLFGEAGRIIEVFVAMSC